MMTRLLRKKILIDARMLSGAFHGIARYAYCVATGIATLRPDWTVGVWTHHPQLWDGSPHSNIVPLKVQAPPFSLREQWELPLSARSFGADLVLFCSIAVPFWLPRRAVATVHDLIPLHFPRSHLHSMILKYFTGTILRRVPKIVCVSRYTRDDVGRNLGIPQDRMEVIYNGGLDGHIDRGEGESAEISQKPYFLCVSNPKPHKNLAVLLEAFRPLEDAFELVLISPTAPWLESALAGRCAIRRLHGLSDGAMTELYQNALGVVVPSLYEGFGIPALEAMQLGAPVISSKVTSLPEVVGDFLENVTE